MKPCKRCGRHHSPQLPCSIPRTTIISPGVTLGFGARVGGASRERYEIGARPKGSKRSTRVLEEILAQGKSHLQKVLAMLAVVSADLPEYTDLLDRESRLSSLIKQIETQIAFRRER